MPQVYTAVNKQMGRKVKFLLIVETQLTNLEGVMTLVSRHLAAIIIFNNLKVSFYKILFNYKKKNSLYYFCIFPVNLKLCPSKRFTETVDLMEILISFRSQ